VSDSCSVEFLFRVRNRAEFDVGHVGIGSPARVPHSGTAEFENDGEIFMDRPTQGDDVCCHRTDKDK